MLSRALVGGLVIVIGVFVIIFRRVLADIEQGHWKRVYGPFLRGEYQSMANNFIYKSAIWRMKWLGVDNIGLIRARYVILGLVMLMIGIFIVVNGDRWLVGH